MVLKNKHFFDDGISNLDDRMYFNTEELNPYGSVGAQETFLSTSDSEQNKYSRHYVCILPP